MVEERDAVVEAKGFGRCVVVLNSELEVGVREVKEGVGIRFIRMTLVAFGPNLFPLGG